MDETLWWSDHRCDIGNGEGCKSCEDDCMCSTGSPYNGVAATIPGFVNAVDFDEGDNVSCCD